MAALKMQQDQQTDRSDCKRIPSFGMGDSSATDSVFGGKKRKLPNLKIDIVDKNQNEKPQPQDLPQANAKMEAQQVNL